MFGSGMENIFIRETGTVTYLILVLVMSTTCMGRALAGRQGERRGNGWLFGAALFLLLLSKVLFVYPYFAERELFDVIYALSALAGLYLLSLSAGPERPEKDSRGRCRQLTLMPLGTGLVLGGGLLPWLIGRTPGAGMVTALLAFTALAPLGSAAGFVWKRGKAKYRPPLSVSVAFLLMAGAVSLGGAISLNITGPDFFWRQLFALLDVAGLFLLLAGHDFRNLPEKALGFSSRGSESRERGGQFPAPRAGESGIGSRVPELSRNIVAGKQAQVIYRDIAQAVAEEAGVRFVLIRTARYDENRLEPKSYVKDGKVKAVPSFSMILKKSKCLHHCNPANALRGGYALDREALGPDGEAFVPAGEGWMADSIFLFPLIDKKTVWGLFTVGYINPDSPGNIPSVLERYADNLMEICKREYFRDKLHDKDKAISACKEELESANQLKSNFLSIVSHELRTPLTSIKAYTETLMDNVGTIKRDIISDFLRVMNEENERVIKLVDNILSYSCLETGHLKVEKKPCNLNRMLENVLEDLEKDFSERNVNRELKLPKTDVIMDADNELIRQLLNNLVSNAVKFAPENGCVVVSLEEEASNARIIVQDNGKGIPEDQLEKIFERFHQVDASNTREHGGSGLGLAICKNIVEWHDGHIWVENVKEAGAKFVVILPMKDIVVRRPSGSEFVGSVRFERERYLSLLVEMLAEFLQARKASIMLLSRDKRNLHVCAAKGLDPEFVQNTKLEAGARIAGKVLLDGESLHVFNIEKDRKVGRPNNSAYYDTRSFISVPLRDGQDVIGVLNVSDHVDNREFTQADREILESLNAVIAGMLKKLDAYETVSANFDKLKEAMKSILHIRESWGSRNLVNYTLIALAVGERLSLDEASLTALRMGMNMYDLGMMKVPRSIRVKKEALTEGEWHKLREHPAMGYALVSPMGLEERIMRIIKSHHEQFDGSGYPEGLIREEIPIEARIINVVDSFRALITQGPYRRCFTLDEARNEILKNSGIKFDPKVVGAFVKTLHDLGVREEKSELVLDAVERELKEKRKEQEDIEENFQKEELVKEEVR
ncbi:MAG: GAF domain-containing protein [Candidatus Krumholzibacteriota bacterium]|nr:GAF domain-containing protein [Candidatus Krumholzibacteriota bacterium]